MAWPNFPDKVRDLLEAEDFQDSSATSATYAVGFEPKTPDFTIAVLPESGPPPTRRFSDFPNFTVRVRHPDGSEANDVLYRIFRFLQEFQGRPGDVPVARITANAGPVQLGFDEDGTASGRWRVSQTFTAIVRQTD